MLAFPTDGWPRIEFMMSVVAVARDPQSPVDAVHARTSGPVLTKARNEITVHFLESPFEWLWMVDTDITFSLATLPAMLRCADPGERPVISALYRSPLEADRVPYPVLYSAGHDEQGRFRFGVIKDPPENRLVHVGAAGAGCLLLHRSVFERISKAKPEDDLLWWAEISVDGEVFGEDMSFCLRAAMAQIPVLAHTGIQVAHVKTSALGEVNP